MKAQLLSLLALGALAPSSLAQEFVVANRGSGDITVFDRDGQLLQTVALPAGTNTPEPMYVSVVGDEVVVGDRGNDRVVRFDKTSYNLLGTVPAGAGVFHQWAANGQLWVNNDVDDTTTVIDTQSWTPIATIPTPAALVAQGYRPHDVFVGNGLAYVSLVGGSGATDWVLQYDAMSFAPLRRRAVGKDPHLWLEGDRLYVASQNSSEVVALDADDLALRDRIVVPGAHGIFLPTGGRTLLVTDITNTGSNALYAIRLHANGSFLAMGTAVAMQATAHNIAGSSFGDRVFVTHSGGSATSVSVYELRPSLRLVSTVTAGTNPFGLAVVP